jgi:hypothetical protein
MGEMNGREIEALRDAFLRAFDPASFDEMLRLRLDRNLAALVGPGPFKTVAFDLITVAVREGWVAELIRAAREYNPGNPALRQFCTDYPHLAPDGAAGPTDDPAAGRREMLELEVGHRVAALPVLLREPFTYTQLHTAKGAVHGKAEHHPQVGKLGEFEPLLGEFHDRSLFDLIWELRRLVPAGDRDSLRPALEAAKALPSFFDKCILVAPVGADDSKWRLDPEYTGRFVETLKRLDVGRWEVLLPTRPGGDRPPQDSTRGDATGSPAGSGPAVSRSGGDPEPPGVSGPVAASRPAGVDRRAVLALFARLKSHQFDEVLFLLGVPVKQRPSEALPIEERKNQLLKWADEAGQLDALREVLRELVEGDGSDRPK